MLEVLVGVLWFSGFTEVAAVASSVASYSDGLGYSWESRPAEAEGGSKDCKARTPVRASDIAGPTSFALGLHWAAF